MRSPYTLDDPPPVDAPVAVVERTAWSLAADLWHGHQPDTLLGADCARCRSPWPCPTWEVADGVLGDVCAARPGAPPPAGPPRGAGSVPLRPGAPAQVAPAVSRPGRHALSDAFPAARRERAADGDRRAAPGTAVVGERHDAPVGWGDAPEVPSESTAARVREALFHPPVVRSGPSAVPDAPRRSGRRRAEPDEPRTDQLPVVPGGEDLPVLGSPPAGRR